MGSITPHSTAVSLRPHVQIVETLRVDVLITVPKWGERDRERWGVVHNQLLVWYGHLQHEMFYGERPSGRWLLWEVTREVTQSPEERTVHPVPAVPSVPWAPGGTRSDSSTEPG